jgi:hypothetical protein
VALRPASRPTCELTCACGRRVVHGTLPAQAVGAVSLVRHVLPGRTHMSRKNAELEKWTLRRSGMELAGGKPGPWPGSAVLAGLLPLSDPPAW